MTDEEETLAWRQMERFARWPTRKNAEAAWEAARRMGTSYPLPEGFQRAPSLKHGIVGALDHHRTRALVPYSFCIAAVMLLDAFLRVKFTTVPPAIHMVAIGLAGLIVAVGATTHYMAGRQILAIARDIAE